MAIAADYLCAYGGGERVAIAMARELRAPLYTSLYDPNRTFSAGAVTVKASWLSGISLLRADHRRALPFLAPLFSTLTVDADVVICSTAGWSHGVQTTGRKVAYWQSPAKWLYRTEDYRAAGTRVGRTAMAFLKRPLARWDARAVASIDLHLANSTFTRELLRRVYGVEATVIPCPQDFSAAGPQEPPTALEGGGYLLCVCRLLPYKNVETLVRAMNDLPHERLVVVGSGPEAARLRAIAPHNVRLLGSVPEAQLRWLYTNCAAVVTASREDFGLTPLEAAAFGRPSIVLRWGGFVDTVVAGVTGVFFDTVSPSAVVAAVREAQATPWDDAVILAHAETFSLDRFGQRLRQVLAENLAA